MQNQIQQTDTVYQTNLDTFSELSLNGISNNSLMLIQQNENTSTELKKVLLSSLKNFILSGISIGHDYTFSEAEQNSDKFVFEKDERDYVFAKEGSSVSIDITSENRSDNIIKFYNYGNDDIVITINSITDLTSETKVRSGWTGEKYIEIAADKYVEVMFVVNIPDSSSAYLTTVKSGKQMEIVR